MHKSNSKHEKNSVEIFFLNITHHFLTFFVFAITDAIEYYLFDDFKGY